MENLFNELQNKDNFEIYIKTEDKNTEKFPKLECSISLQSIFLLTPSQLEKKRQQWVWNILCFKYL